MSSSPNCSCQSAERIQQFLGISLPVTHLYSKKLFWSLLISAWQAESIL